MRARKRAISEVQAGEAADLSKISCASKSAGCLPQGLPGAGAGPAARGGVPAGRGNGPLRKRTPRRGTGSPIRSVAGVPGLHNHHT